VARLKVQRFPPFLNGSCASGSFKDHNSATPLICRLGSSPSAACRWVSYPARHILTSPAVADFGASAALGRLPCLMHAVPDACRDVANACHGWLMHTVSNAYSACRRPGTVRSRSRCRSPVPLLTQWGGLIHIHTVLQRTVPAHTTTSGTVASSR